MDGLRKPFFILALILIAIVVLMELGSSLMLSAKAGVPDVNSLTSPDLKDAFTQLQQSGGFQQLTSNKDNQPPPGMGIPYMAWLDGVLLFNILLIAVSLVIPERIHGRLQGCAAFLFALFVILGSLVAIFAAITLVLIMVALFLAVPFGTLAYLAIYGFFDRGGASAVLSLIMLLKIGFAISLVVAHERFLQNTGLVLLIITSLVGNVVISFLQGIVPGILVSITDGIAAIIVALLGCGWAILLLLGAIVGIIKAIQLKV